MAERMVRVEWLDAHGAPAGWEFEDEFAPAVSRVVSVGHLLARDAEFVVLVPHLAQPTAGGRRQFAGHLAIPAAQVISVCELVTSPAEPVPAPADPQPASAPIPPASWRPACCSSAEEPCQQATQARGTTSRSSPCPSPSLTAPAA